METSMQKLKNENGMVKCKRCLSWFTILGYVKHRDCTVTLLQNCRKDEQMKPKVKMTMEDYQEFINSPSKPKQKMVKPPITRTKSANKVRGDGGKNIARQRNNQRKKRIIVKFSS